MSKLKVGFWSNTLAHKKMLCEAKIEDTNGSYPDVNDFIDSTWNLEEKTKILNHIKNGTYNGGYRGWSICRICNQKNGSQEFTDGTYIWPEGFSHYITDHNVKPPQTFINHIKKAYFQGGGGINEPTPGKKKYKSDKAIVVQPRFEEPFYRNYDLYDVPGVSGGEPKHGPGAGWNSMHKYKSISEFLKAKRKKLKDKYKADDSWIEDTESNRKERISKMKTRANLISKITKMAIDFAIDDQIHSDPILGESGAYSDSVPIGGASDEYLPQPDFEGKLPTELNFGRDYTDESCSDDDITYDHGRDAYKCNKCNLFGPNGPIKPKPSSEELHFKENNDSDDLDDLKMNPEKLEKLMEKYINQFGTDDLYGLPDGVDSLDEDLGNPSNINPEYGTTDNGSNIYDKM